jgi:hypothetical protein
VLCKLCQQQETIQNSHIVPRFVSQWIKETSPLGGLRDLEKPNLRQEDTQKSPLLCSDCERRISVSEGNFAKEIFIPLNDHGILEFTYGTWLLTFAVSLSWRVGQSLLNGLRMKNAQVAPRVEQALQVWSDYLLGARTDTQQYSHHLFFDTQFSSRIFAGQAYDYRYAHRTIDCAIAYGAEEVAIYTKLPSMIFYSPIYPTAPTGFKGTYIEQSGTLVAQHQEVADGFFWGYVQDSTEHSATSMASMSEKQKRQLEERMRSAKPEWQIRQEREKGQ